MKKLLKKILRPLFFISSYIVDGLVRLRLFLNKKKYAEMESVVRSIFKPYSRLDSSNVKSRHCPICAAKECGILSDLYYVEIVRCANCGFDYVNKEYDNLLVQQIFDEIRGRHNKDGKEYWKYDSLADFEEKLDSKIENTRNWFKGLKKQYGLDFDSSGRFLDVGAADGICCFAATREGFEKAVGLEFDSSRISIAKKYAEHHGIQNVEFYAQKIEDFKSDRNVDFIRMGDVLEHLAQPGVVLESCKKILSQDGLLYIEVPNMESHSVRTHGLLHRFYQPVHINYFTPKSLRQIVTQAGFKIRHFDSSGFTLGTELFNPLILTAWSKYGLVHEMPLSNLEKKTAALMGKLGFVEGLINRLVFRNNMDGRKLICIAEKRPDRAGNRN